MNLSTSHLKSTKQSMEVEMQTERCRRCGATDCDHPDIKVERIKVLSVKERRKCYHDWKPVWGVHSWNFLCLKCGGMRR